LFFFLLEAVWDLKKIKHRDNILVVLENIGGIIMIVAVLDIPFEKAQRSQRF
jgi:hypothetical protein